MSKKLTWSSEEKRFISSDITEDDDDLGLDDLIDSLRAKELSHVFNEDGKRFGAESSYADLRPLFDDIETSSVEDIKRPRKKIEIKMRTSKTNRIDHRSEKYFVKRSYHDQYLLERAWLYLGKKTLTEEITISRNFLQNSDIIQPDHPAYVITTQEDSRADIIDTTDDANVNTEVKEIGGQSDDNGKEDQDQEHDCDQDQDQDQDHDQDQDQDRDQEDELNQDLTIYKLDDCSYIFPMSKEGIPGSFWGIGQNEDFARPIEAIELFRLSDWKEDQYSYKLFFSEETYLLTTLMRENGPRSLEEIIPCGLEFFTNDFIKIQL